MYFVSIFKVSLGATNDLKQANYDANKLPAGKSSTKGIGRSGPDQLSGWRSMMGLWYRVVN